jgi:hypothetical protein
MPSKLSILVYIASPLDYARYRHAALYLEFETAHTASGTEGISKFNDSIPNTEDDIKSSVMEVVGSPGNFMFYERLNTSPVPAIGK